MFNVTMFKHPAAIVETDQIGDGTRIWAFAHILPGARIGRDCNICDHTFIENHVVIGDRVTIKCGVQVWDGVSIEDDVFIGPNATFTNDNFPRSKAHQKLEEIPRTCVKSGASIGANATVLPGITIGERAMVGAGAVVTRSIPPDTIVVGNPARIVGYVGAKTKPPVPSEPRPTEVGPLPTGVAGVTSHRLPLVEDLRGSLSFAEVSREIPFEVKRYFLVFGVVNKHIRGEHAHKTLHQFLICVHGSCHVVADDGATREEFVLDSPCLGLHVAPLIWLVHYKYSPDAVLLVLTSDSYDANDYIRDYEQFLASTAVRP